MITKLLIERFKSIRHLNLECRRINLFIGEPNTGKSNILEALAMLSWLGNGRKTLPEYIRLNYMQNLFYDNLIDEPVLVACDGKPAGPLTVEWKHTYFQIICCGKHCAQIGYRGEGSLPSRVDAFAAVKFYRYCPVENYVAEGPGQLLTPDGANLVSVIFGSKVLRAWLADLFRPYGLTPVIKPHEQTIEVQKQHDGIAISYPFQTISETLRRVLFYYVAMQSNSDAVLVFEEPEAHAFPYYTKYLGEQIAENASNQYFIATHNPYLLISIVEKAGKEDVAVFATRYVDYETRAIMLSDDQIVRLLEADPFLGLESVLEDA